MLDFFSMPVEALWLAVAFVAIMADGVASRALVAGHSGPGGAIG